LDLETFVAGFGSEAGVGGAPAGPGNACVVSVASAAWNEANVGSASVPASPPSGSGV
jgi:hypothetical protein